MRSLYALIALLLLAFTTVAPLQFQIEANSRTPFFSLTHADAPDIPFTLSASSADNPATPTDDLEYGRKDIVYQLGTNTVTRSGALANPTLPGITLNWETAWYQQGYWGAEWQIRARTATQAFRPVHMIVREDGHTYWHQTVDHWSLIRREDGVQQVSMADGIRLHNSATLTSLTNNTPMIRQINADGATLIPLIRLNNADQIRLGKIDTTTVANGPLGMNGVVPPAEKPVLNLSDPDLAAKVAQVLLDYGLVELVEE